MSKTKDKNHKILKELHFIYTDPETCNFMVCMVQLVRFLKGGVRFVYCMVLFVNGTVRFVNCTIGFLHRRVRFTGVVARLRVCTTNTYKLTFAN